MNHPPNRRVINPYAKRRRRHNVRRLAILPALEDLGLLLNTTRLRVVDRRIKGPRNLIRDASHTAVDNSTPSTTKARNRFADPRKCKVLNEIRIRGAVANPKGDIPTRCRATDHPRTT